MEDLCFENELMNQEINKVKRYLEDYKVHFRLNGKISEITKLVFQNFEDVLDLYYSKIYGNNKGYDEIYEMTEEFKKKLIDDELLKMYNKHCFTKEEKEYIKLVQISSTWRGNHWLFSDSAKFAITDILLRAKIVEQFGEKALQDFREIIKNKVPKTEENRKMIEHYMQLLSDNPYGENIHKELEDRIKEKACCFFNKRINCGGYALKIDQWFSPTEQSNFSKSVSSILEKFPFVRLLGDKLLEDDEYLVIYRAPKGENTGHHFIRVDSDAIVREKNGNEEPRIFKDWGNLKDCEEALFAVKKEHKMFGYNSEEINYNHEGLDFNESVAKAISEQQNLFSYHNHSFCLKKSKQEEVFVTTTDGHIVAYVVADKDDCLVEVIESEKKYVENTSGAINPIINNGRLINYEQFKSKSRDTSCYDER